MLGRRSGGVTVFVDQTTKDLGAPDGSADAGPLDGGVTHGWQLPQRAVRTVRVVVPVILGQHVTKLPLAEYQHPIQALAADRAHPPLGVSVGLRRARRTTQYGDADISEHGIEARGELRVTITDQEPELVSPAQPVRRGYGGDPTSDSRGRTESPGHR